MEAGTSEVCPRKLAKYQIYVEKMQQHIGVMEAITSDDTLMEEREQQDSGTSTLGSPPLLLVASALEVSRLGISPDCDVL